MLSEYYVQVTGMILRMIPMEGNCCGYLVTLRPDDGRRGTVQFALTGETVVVDMRRLYPGMRAAMFYDTRLPMPLIYPPRYQAQLIAAPDRNGQVMLNFFDRTLTAADGSLKLNVGPRTQVQTINGQRFLCSPGNRTLLVYYTATTRSVPPQTTPQKIVVLCGEG